MSETSDDAEKIVAIPSVGSSRLDHLETRMLLAERVLHETVASLKGHVEQCDKRAAIAEKLLWYLVSLVTASVLYLLGEFMKTHFGL